jgi:hypothetical protein
MNTETLNRDVLVVIALFAVLLYFAMVAAGFSELMSRMPKPKAQRKRSKAGEQLRSPKKSS